MPEIRKIIDFLNVVLTKLLYVNGVRMASEQTAQSAVCSILERGFDDVIVREWIQINVHTLSKCEKQSIFQRCFADVIVRQCVQSGVKTMVKVRKNIDFEHGFDDPSSDTQDPQDSHCSQDAQDCQDPQNSYDS